MGTYAGGPGAEADDRYGKYGAVLLGRLRAVGFLVEECAEAGRYVVTASPGGPLPLRPRLHLPASLLDEYVARLADEEGSLEGALGLMLVHVEEDLESVSVDGRNHTVALGVERAADGRAAWFVQAEPVDVPSWLAEGEYEWRAYPEG